MYYMIINDHIYGYFDCIYIIIKVYGYYEHDGNSTTVSSPGPQDPSALAGCERTNKFPAKAMELPGDQKIQGPDGLYAGWWFQYMVSIWIIYG